MRKDQDGKAKFAKHRAKPNDAARAGKSFGPTDRKAFLKPKVISRDEMSRSRGQVQADATSEARPPRARIEARPESAYQKPLGERALTPAPTTTTAATNSPWGAIKPMVKSRFAKPQVEDDTDDALEHDQNDAATARPARPSAARGKPRLDDVRPAPRRIAPVLQVDDDADDENDNADTDAPYLLPGEPHIGKTLRDRETRIYGRHAVAAIAEHRIDAVRKVYYHRSAQNQLADLLRWCAANRIGYREVELDDLHKLSGSEHHEGVVLEITKPEQPTIAALLERLASKPSSTLVLLDGVANPHNIGAILRIAAHFDVDAVLLNPGNTTALSGACYRVAEGGAEAQPYISLQSDSELQAIKAAGYQLIATQMRQAKTLWGAKMPKRCVIVLGAEASGVSDYMYRNADLRLQIPGSGKVESLNVAQSAAIVLAEIQRQHARYM